MDELTLLRDAHHVDPPDVDLIERERAALDNLIAYKAGPRSPRLPRPRRRPRLALAAIGGVTVLVGGAVAAAAGILPDGVRDRFGLTADNDQGMRADPDAAELQATYTSPDGTYFELWFAPTDGDGGCFTVTRGGDADDPFASCTSSLGDVHPEFVIYQAMHVGDRLAVYGTAPRDATTVTLTFGGQSTTAPVTDHEFFMVIDQPECKQATCEITVSAYDSTGRLVATGL